MAIILDAKLHKTTGEVVKMTHYPLELSSGLFYFKRKDHSTQYNQPSMPLDIYTMAQHHITPKELSIAPQIRSISLNNSVKYIISHDADQATKALSLCGINRKLLPISTRRIAEKLLPELQQHDLYSLSYYFATDKDKLASLLTTGRNQLTDADLTASLLNHLIKNIGPEHKQNLAQLYLFNLDCHIPIYMTFGTHRGLSVPELPDTYKNFILNSENIDPWLKLAVKLHNANLIRQTYEITNKMAANTYSDYDFIDSVTPIKQDKITVLEKTLFHGLGLNYE